MRVVMKVFRSSASAGSTAKIASSVLKELGTAEMALSIAIF